LAAAPSSSLFPFLFSVLFSVIFRNFSLRFNFGTVDNLAESTLLGGGKIKKKRSKLEDRQKAPSWLVGKSGKKKSLEDRKIQDLQLCTP